MRDLALRLAELKHEVTYLTMRHWDAGAPPALPGVRVVGLVEPRLVYGTSRRTFGPPLRFGLGVARHLVRPGRPPSPGPPARDLRRRAGAQASGSARA